MPFRERGRLKIGGRMKLMRWCIRLWQASPHMKWQTNVDSHTAYTTTNTSSSHQKLTFPCVWVSTKHGTDEPAPPQVKPTLKGSDIETTPWEASGLAITQHQTSKTSLGRINGKLCLLPWMSTGVSTEDGWRLQVMCSGSGCLQDHMCLAEG